VLAAIRADLTITGRQRQVLIDIYESFRKDDLAGSREAQPTQPAEPPIGGPSLLRTASHTGLQGRATMALTTRVKKITKSKPFYAVAGAADYAVGRLRKLPKQLQRRQGQVRETAKELPSKARKTVTENLPEPAREYTDTVTTRISELYDELAVRGRKIVAKASGEAAQELKEVSESAKPATAREEEKAPASKPVSRTKTTSRA
jgi:hypothetical protein